MGDVKQPSDGTYIRLTDLLVQGSSIVHFREGWVMDEWVYFTMGMSYEASVVMWFFNSNQHFLIKKYHQLPTF